MSQFLLATLHIAVVVLLPLVPAILLYRVLGSNDEDAHISGPFKGFRLKLSGAVAAYFVVVLVTWQIYSPPEKEEDPIQIYTLEGTLALPDDSVSDWMSVEATDRLDFSARPPSAEILSGNGNFEMRFAYNTSSAGDGGAQTVRVEYGDCYADIFLDELEQEEPKIGGREWGLEYEGDRTIVAQEPILLTSRSPESSSC